MHPHHTQVANIVDVGLVKQLRVEMSHWYQSFPRKGDTPPEAPGFMGKQLVAVQLQK